jgi:hypothetical protein
VAGCSAPLAAGLGNGQTLMVALSHSTNTSFGSCVKSLPSLVAPLFHRTLFNRSSDSFASLVTRAFA